MKINVELDLIWYDEDGEAITVDEAIQARIVDSVANKVQKNIPDRVETKVEAIIDETIVKNINAKIDTLFEDFTNKEITLIDKYGDSIRTYPTILTLVKERFDNFLTERVDDKGRIYDNYGEYSTRLEYIIDKQLKDFADEFTTDAVKQVSAEIKEHVKDGLTSKLGAELMKTLKIDKMIGLPQ